MLIHPAMNGHYQTTNNDDSKNIPTNVMSLVENESLPEDERDSKSFQMFHSRASMPERSSMKKDICPCPCIRIAEKKSPLTLSPILLCSDAQLSLAGKCFMRFLSLLVLS